MEKLTFLLKKYRDVLSYLFFGVLTTAVNYLVYLPCYNYFSLSAAVSNIIAWAVSVAFAFLTNKPLVFQSHDWSVSTVVPELGKFVSCRLLSGAMETGILYVTVDCLHMDGNIMKIIVSVLVVVANYFGSKLLVFRKKK